MKNIKKREFLLLFSLLLLTSNFSLQANNYISNVRIAKYKGDKICAISYTFDDGFLEHYTIIAPELEKRDLRGTFWINGSSINEDELSITNSTRMTWSQLKEMSDNGHEISNHGWAHKNFGRHSIDEIKEDICKNDSAIYKHTGVMPRTFCYPNNKKTPEGVEFVSKNRVGTRTEQHSLGGKATREYLDKWLETLIQTAGWGVGMTHGITYGYDAFKNPQTFWDHLDKVKSLDDKIWVGTFCEVSAYIKERENIELNVIKKKNKIKVVPSLKLDKNLFSEHLTMVLDLEKIKKITVTQNKRKLSTQIFTNKAIFDFDPFGGEILIEFNLGK